MRMFGSFPLLAKELVEQSVRRRTYAARSLYALVLLAIFVSLCTRSYMRYGYGGNLGFSGSYGLVGQGGELFDSLFDVQYWAILVLMPILTAGVLTVEKEQGTLSILLLTDMGPWELLLQKLLSRLVTAVTLVLLGLPLMAISYAYGGVSTHQLVTAPLTLFIVSVQSGAVALAVSAWCYSTVGAMITTAIALPVVYLAPLLMQFLVILFAHYDSHPDWRSDWLWPGRVIPQLQFGFQRPWYGFGQPSVSNDDWQSIVIAWAADNTWVILSCIVFLVVARLGLLRRIERSGPGKALRFFRWMDQAFVRVDRRMGRRVAATTLPDTDPVAWRETHRRSFASWHYLLRCLVPFIGLGIVILADFIFRGPFDMYPGFEWFAFILFGLLLLLMVVLGARLVAGERSDQTLEVLLTTPILPAELVAQKAQAMWRVAWVLLVPLVLAVVLAVFTPTARMTWNYGAYHPMHDRAITLCGWGLSVAILPPLFAWSAVAIGLLVRSRSRAILTAIIGACIWLGSLFAFAFLITDIFRCDRGDLSYLVIFLTPTSIPLLTLLAPEEMHAYWGGPWPTILLYAVWHAGLWFAVRRWCLRNADRLMHRVAGGS